MIRKRRNVTHLPGSIATAIRDCLHNNPFSTSQEVAEFVSCSCHIKRSRSYMSRYIKQCRFSRKKAYRIVDHKHSVDDPVVEPTVLSLHRLDTVNGDDTDAV